MPVREYIRHVDDDIARQDRHDEFNRQLSSTDAPGVAAKIFEDLGLTSAVENRLEHGLNIAPRGWRIVRQDGKASIWEVAGSVADRRKFLVLATDTNVTVSVEVF